MAKRNFPEKLNICLTAYHFPILGRVTDKGFLWPIARGLAAQGHKVTVISAKSPTSKHEVERDGVRVFFLHEGTTPYLHMPFERAVYNKFCELHKSEAFHIVHSIDRSAYQIAKNKKQLKVAVAYDVEATQMSQVFSIMGMGQETASSKILTGIAVTYKFLTTYFGRDRKLLKTANGIFVTTPQQRVALERFYLFPDYHTYTVPYGIELGNLSPKETSITVRKTLNLSESAKIVLTVSDMSEILEIKNMLMAFEKLAIKKPNTFYVIVGNGPKIKEIEYEMLNLALGSRVHMVGALTAEQLSDYIAASDVYLNMSSRSTGFEPSMIEAMAQKKIVIGSEVSPISYIIEDGKDGFLLRPADVQSIGQLLVEIFNENLAAQDIGEKARQKVLDLFDTKKMISTIVDAYKKIVKNSDII